MGLQFAVLTAAVIYTAIPMFPRSWFQEQSQIPFQNIIFETRVLETQRICGEEPYDRTYIYQQFVDTSINRLVSPPTAVNRANTDRTCWSSNYT
jgi:hypothetical protein